VIGNASFDGGRNANSKRKVIQRSLGQDQGFEFPKVSNFGSGAIGLRAGPVENEILHFA
jgi:hypothetical protein